MRRTRSPDSRHDVLNISGTPSANPEHDVERIVRSIGVNIDGQDILQIAHLKRILRPLRHGATPPTSPEQYQKRILVNAAMDELRRQERDRKTSLSWLNRQITDAERARRERIQIAVREAVENLPPKQRDVIRFDLEGWTNQEIAEEFGVRPRTVSKWRRQAQQQLIYELGEFP